MFSRLPPRQVFSLRFLSPTLGFRTFSSPNSQLNLTRLDNGVRITSEESASPLSLVSVSLEAGTSHQKEDNGIARHVRTALLNNAFIGAQKLELVGQTSAYTTRDRTVLTVSCLKDQVPFAVAQIGSLLKTLEGPTEQFLMATFFNPDLTTEEIVTEHLYSIAFQNHPLSFTAFGRISAKPEEYVDFVSSRITGPRIILSGVGVRHEDLVESGKQFFSDFSSSAGTPATVPRFVGSKVDIRDDYLPKAHISYAVQAPGMTSDSYLTARVIQAILGDWDISHGVANNSTSRIAETTALEHLADKVKGFYHAYQTTGLLGVYTVADPHELEDFSVEVLTEFVRISQKVSQAEVERAKARVKHEILASFSTSPALLETITQQVFYNGRRIPVDELITKLKNITQSDVRKLAEELLYDVDPVIAAYGPTTHLPDYNRLRSWMYWNRL